jgi:hypothetical protein
MVVTGVVLPFRGAFNLIVGGLALFELMRKRFRSSQLGSDLRLQRELYELRQLREIRATKLSDLARVEREIELLERRLEQPKNNPFRGEIPAKRSRAT